MVIVEGILDMDMFIEVVVEWFCSNVEDVMILI